MVSYLGYSFTTLFFELPESYAVQSYPWYLPTYCSSNMDNIFGTWTGAVQQVKN